MTKYLIILLLALDALAVDSLLPDSRLTPGDVMTNVTVETICQRGYANVLNGGVRNVPDSRKREVFIAYFGAVPASPGAYEIDHLVSLQLGGSNSRSNLWPQSYLTHPWNSHVKDRLENRLATNVRHELAAHGPAVAEQLLNQYQRDISDNWTNLYGRVLGPLVTPLKCPRASAQLTVPMGEGKP